MGALALGLGFTACENLEDELADANTTIENLQGDLSEARSDLAEANATIAANAAELAELSASLVSVRDMLASSAADLLSLEGTSAEQIAGLQSQLAALAAEQAAELAELAEARAALASANADQAAALEARIAELISNSEALAAQLAELRANPIMVEVIRVQRILADAIYTDYEPAFTNQIASFEQSRTITINAAGGESLSGTQTRTLEVTNSVSTESVTTYNGLDSLEAAQAAIEANEAIADGAVVEISVSITTTETTTYSAEGYDSFDVVGTPSTTAGTAISYTKSSEPVAATFSATNNIVGGEVNVGDDVEFTFATNQDDIFVISAAGNIARVLTADEIANGLTLTVGDPNRALPVALGFSVRFTVGNADGAELALVTADIVAAAPVVDPADTPGAWSYSYIGGTDANWDAGEISLTANTQIEFIDGVRTRVWTINGERDASTPSNLNASNQEVETKRIRNSAYVAPMFPVYAWVQNGNVFTWEATSQMSEAASITVPVGQPTADSGFEFASDEDFSDGSATQVEVDNSIDVSGLRLDPRPFTDVAVEDADGNSL